MSHDDRIIGLAKQFYGSVLSDLESTLRDQVADDFVLENYLPPNIPFGGKYEGRQGLATYFGELAAAIDMGPLEFHEWISEGNTVVVRGRESSTVPATGKRYVMDFVHWLRFDDEGKLVLLREFNDTVKLADAFKGDRP